MEWFTATLTSTSDNVNIGDSIANVTILDGKIDGLIVYTMNTVFNFVCHCDLTHSTHLISIWREPNWQPLGLVTDRCVLHHI